MNSVMLDLETFSSQSNAYICQIGACYFDIETGELGDTFLINCFYNNKDNLFSIDPNNILFWLQQKKEVQQSLLTDLRPIQEVLQELKKFCKKTKAIWSHSTFDFVVLMNAYRLLNLSSGNIHYRVSRDIRTLMTLAHCHKNDFESQKVIRTDQHNALADCKYQVQYVSFAYNRLKNKE